MLCALENKPLCLNRDNKEITNSGEDSAREEKARDVVPLNVVVLVIVITILTHLVMFVQELLHPFFWNVVFLELQVHRNMALARLNEIFSSWVLLVQ